MKLNTNDEIKNFALKAIKCESEDELITLLKKYNLWKDISLWRFYGDKSNNISTIGNQAPDAEKALVEKIANSFDARLMLECKKRGLNPKESGNPKNIKEAIQEYFYNGNEFKNFMSLENETVIFATNTKEEPCISLVDKGEGQTPLMVPETFLSLDKENKEGILFTQGRYNQGGSGAVSFCNGGLSLILTRKCPEINKDKSSNNDFWSITITRYISAKERKLPEPCYVYLAPVNNDNKSSGEVLSFKSDTMKILPKDMEPYQKELSYGSLIKLYGYQMKGADTNIMFDFMYNTEIMMPDAVMPVRLHECRDNYKSDQKNKNFRKQVTTLQGFKYRNSENKALESGFPIFQSIDFKGFTIDVDIYAFKYDKNAPKGRKNLAKTRKRKNEGVVFCLGGQHYSEFTSDFFRRKNVGLDYLKDDLIVIVNCSAIDGDLKNTLFKTDKSTQKDTKEMNQLTSEIEDILKTNQKLEDLVNLRRKQKVEEKLADDKPFEDLLRDVIKKNPSLAALFNLGPRLSNPWLKDQQGSSRESIDKKLQYFPSFFKFKKNLEEGEEYERSGNINKRLRFDFETDAMNDYFSRKKDNGVYSININLLKKNGNTANVLNENITNSQFLDNGHWLVSITIPEETEIGDVLNISFKISDTNNESGWELISKVNILEPVDTTKHKKKKKKKNNSGKNLFKTGFTLPTVTWVNEEDWEENKMNEKTALKIIKAKSEKINGKDVELWDFYLNRDNKFLHNELKTNKKGLQEDIIVNRYKLSLVFFSLSLIDSLSSNQNNNNIEDDVEKLTAGISPVLLDVIDSVGDLSEAVE